MRSRPSASRPSPTAPEGVEKFRAEAGRILDGGQGRPHPTGGPQGEEGHARGGQQHQQALDHVGRHRRPHAPRCSVEPHHDHPQGERRGSGPGTEVLVEGPHAFRHHPQSEHLSGQVGHRAEQHRRRRPGPRRPRGEAPLDDLGQAEHLAPLRHRPQAAAAGPAQRRRRESQRREDHQRSRPHAQSQPRSTDEDETAEGRRHGGQGDRQQAGPLACEKKVARRAGPSPRPEPDPQHQQQVNAGCPEGRHPELPALRHRDE